MLKLLPSVRTLFILAAFCAIIVYGFRESITKIALIGNLDALSMLLAFLALFLIIILGIAGFYAISKKEIQADEKRSNITRIEGSERIDTEQLGVGGAIEIKDSKDVNSKQNNSIGHLAEKKK